MSKPVVICVDDEPMVLESLKIDLKRVLGEACLIETAESGEEALELIEEFQQSGEYEVALVLADYIMPGLRGDDLLKQIHQRSPQTLNVMISGQADLDAVSEALQNASLYRYIPKPWTSEELKQTIAGAIQKYLEDRKLEAQTKEIQTLNITLERQVRDRTRELHQKMQELEQLNRLKDEFLHAVTHDLRTPLTGAILVFKQLQKQTAEPITLSRSMVDRMVESCERQLKLLDSLLAVQLSDAKGLALNLEPTHLKDFVETVVQDLEPLLIANQVTVHNPIPVELPIVNIDGFQFRRVIENLISNALKHNPPGISITIQAAVENHVVQCSIQDNGVGIPEHECASIFKRYVQGSRGRRSMGVGLGLYLCRQIVQAHGGEIGVVSALNQGTKFWFTLPIATDREA
jgi:two-component system, sensor histidine kinase and response regulator